VNRREANVARIKDARGAAATQRRGLNITFDEDDE
jgi:hypothetical protein